MNAASSSGDGVLIDDGSAAQQRPVGLHQNHGLPGVLSESGVKLSNATGNSVIVTHSTRAGRGSHQVSHSLLHEVLVLLLLLQLLLLLLQLLLLLLELQVLLSPLNGDGLLAGLDTLLLAGLAWGLVGTVIKERSDDLTVVLSENGGWPWVNVVGVTAALANNVLAHVTAVGEGHAERLLLLGEHNWGPRDDTDSVAELQLSAVHGGRAGLGHNGEGFVLISAVDDVGRVVGAVWDTGWDVVGSLELGGGDRTLGGHGGNVTGSGHGRNVTGGWGASGLRGRNVTRSGVGGLRCRGLVTAAHVNSEASRGLWRERERERG